MQRFHSIVLTLWIQGRAFHCAQALSSPIAGQHTTSASLSFQNQVTSWLGAQPPDFSWSPADPTLFPQTNHPVLHINSEKNERSIWLHLLPSPLSPSDCVSPTCARSMIENSLPVIHLHQDVWNAKQPIVKSRLLMRLGQFQTRLFARKTQARRITAALALPFLQDHHLWSAVKSKYYYGLFSAEDQLVAVASFSSRRRITRAGVVHKSHELIRFCTRRDGMVVGGISKLVKAFVKDQQPDDIVTVVDRDWGPGDGWHQLGFETVHVMPPLAMVVSSQDGIRRHLVGAGISSGNNQQNGRLGLEEHILEELGQQTSHEGALQCLSRYGYYPVYDAGVERLLMIVPKQGQDTDQKLSALELWQESVPTYASTYYSNNAGINALLENAKEVVIQSDSSDPKEAMTAELEAVFDDNQWDDPPEEQQSISKVTAGTVRTAKLLFSAPSSLDPTATVEVRQRPDGWCTLGTIGGRTIYHGLFKINNNQIDPSNMISEHLRTMASLAMASLAAKKDPLKFLYFGYGAGTLMRFLAHAVGPHSQHVAVELDQGVVRAATQCPLLVTSHLALQALQTIHLGDALEYRRPQQDHAPFDCLFVDVFDGDNQVPTSFYGPSFLDQVRQGLLCPQHGFVVHNFRTGNCKLQAQLEEATKAYREVFPTVLLVDSLDSQPNTGNTILLAFSSTKPLDDLPRAATLARTTWNVNFDLAARATNNLRQ